MVEKNLPAYLPQPFMDETAYQKLYEHLFGVDDFELEDLEEPIAINSSMTAEQVYRMLPIAPDFEYGGFITTNEIYYQVGEEFSASTQYSQPCTWHSHPTSHPYADAPSYIDVYFFLKWRSRRAITVGREWIWVFDKCLSTLPTIEKLRSWEELNSTTRYWYWMGTEREIDGYAEEALGVLGLQRIEPISNWLTNWQKSVEALGIKVTLIRVDADAVSRVP